MSNRTFFKPAGSLDREVVKLYGSVTFGSSGAVASSDCLGFAVTIVAAKDGRYLVTLEDQYNRFMGCNMTLVEATDAAMTATEGHLLGIVRNVSMTSKTFEIQLCQSGDASDADPASGNVLHIEIILGRVARDN